MCGIYGIIDLDDRARPKRELMRAMGRVLSHRGPDDEGEYYAENIALGMRRLSIIDVGGGHQPIANEDESVWVVCNGEIYNFKSLREDLETKGHIFRCNSDTEVIVHLYEEKGVDLFRHLRGMFALALWDKARDRLIIARDRLGKKPLYIRQEPGRLLFASEIKSILQDRDIPRRVRLEALEEYLALGYVPAPNTLFEGIHKVFPGHYLLIEKGQVLNREYWDVDFDRQENNSEQEWVEIVREKLMESVRVRLVSDVPLGAFLSGGIDSSAIVAAMAQQTGQPVKTYSIGFEGKDSFYNELPYARVVADAFNTDHHEIIVRPEVSELLPKLIWFMDEPIADSAFITTYLVSKLAAESVKVILSGVGGDELFGGYRRYLSDRLMPYYNVLPPLVRKKWLPAILGRIPQDRHSKWENYCRLADAFIRSADLPSAQRYTSYVTLFSREARNALLKVQSEAMTINRENGGAGTLSHYFDQCRHSDSLNQIIYVDLKTSLPDDLLLLTDKMSMAASIECRAPFVDHELVELTSRIPANLKVRGLSMKHLLKKAVAPWLPKEILQRKKRGFGAPMGAWLRHDLSNLVRDTLSEAQVKKRGLLDWRVIENTIIRHNAHRSDETDNLLALVNLELWCQIFLDGHDTKYYPTDCRLAAGSR